MVANRLIAVILDLKPLCLLVKRSILKLPVLFRMNKEDFSQAKGFIFSDIERELQLACTDPGTLKAIGINSGGGNFLAALGLLCYTEFAGKLKYNRKKDNGNDSPAENFNLFFDDLGTDYKTFRILGNDVYGIFRCGLAHEYYVKGNCTIFMLSQGSRLGIGKDS
jgi:hypothetical protein